MARTATAPERLPFTGDDEADRLIASDPVALLIGFVLDQQVTVQKAFAGPLELRKRLGHLDVAKHRGDRSRRRSRRRSASVPPLHRFPGAMAERVRALCAFLEERYDGDAARIWREAASGEDLQKPASASCPGFGEMKVRTVMTLLARQFGVAAARASTRCCPTTRRSATCARPRSSPPTRPASAPSRPRGAPQRPTDRAD